MVRRQPLRGSWLPTKMVGDDEFGYMLADVLKDQKPNLVDLGSEFQNFDTYSEFQCLKGKVDPDAVYRDYTLPRNGYRRLQVYPEFTCMPVGDKEIPKHFGRPGVLFNAPRGNFKQGSCKGAFTTCLFASTLGAVGAIAPETARDGYMQAGSSKSDTSNFWFGVVACVGVLVAFIGVVVAIMQLRRSRRTQSASAPTQQMPTLMQRRSRVQYIVEEETVHRIDEMA